MTGMKLSRGWPRWRWTNRSTTCREINSSMHTDAYMHLYECSSRCTCTCTVYTCTYTTQYTSMYMCVYMYIYTYVHVHVYIYTLYACTQYGTKATVWYQYKKDVLCVYTCNVLYIHKYKRYMYMVQCTCACTCIHMHHMCTLLPTRRCMYVHLLHSCCQGAHPSLNLETQHKSCTSTCTCIYIYK